MSNESLDRFAQSKLDHLTANGLRRSVVDTQRTDAVNIRRGSRDLVSFCCNDYLGLTHHPAVKGGGCRRSRRRARRRCRGIAPDHREPPALRRSGTEARGFEGHGSRLRVRKRLYGECRYPAGAGEHGTT